MGDSMCTTSSIEPVVVASSSSSSSAAAVQVQSFDQATVRPEATDNASDRRVSVQGMEDSRMFGVKTEPVTGGASVNVILSGEKRKRGRPKGQKATVKAPPKVQMEEEDVCFICFDGGSLVLCDRKGCPKAYHPACIKRDEAFFQCKAKWNCGWHICSVCHKSSHFMCYTCTYSLCKGCSKEADFSFVRGNMGFCTVCMRTIMLIENKDLANKEMVQVDFDDKTSWEYLFKVYWILLKEKLCLTVDELTKAKNPSKGVGSLASKQLLPDRPHIGHHNNGFVSYAPHNHSKQDRPNELHLTTDKPKEEAIETKSSVNGASVTPQTEWASKVLLDFVAHMKNGNTSLLSQFDVQALLLEYIKKNNLWDPRRKCEITCDLRLKNLFGKPRVGHIEMLKLLECHLFIKDSQKDTSTPAGALGNVVSPFDFEDTNGSSVLENKNKRRKTSKKDGERTSRNDLDEYAAIDVHNINLIYMRRDLMENLLKDEKFHDKVIGSFVRIRISSSDLKQDLYRLVQVVGISKVAVPNRSDEKTVDVMLEVLNLNKKEAITVDTISSQEFSEEECRRLRQSIRCGLARLFTVGEIEKKALELQAARLNYILEEEILKLKHLQDQASDENHKKELGECIKKLELLKSPEERQYSIPEVHADPKMNPDYESEEDGGVVNDRRQDEYTSPTHSGLDGPGNKPTTSKRKVEEEGLINHQRKVNQKIDANCLSDQTMTGLTPEIPTAASHSTGNSYSPSDSETDKLWHYRDPSGKIQGPFSIEQLQKWSTTGYFPPDMRIWTSNEQDDSILLTDALNGTFHTAAHLLYNFSLHCQQLGAASDNHTHGSDVGHNGKVDIPSNDSQIVEASLSSNARVQSDNSNEDMRTDGLGSSSFSSSSVGGGKDTQPGTSENQEMKDSNSCSDHSQVSHPPPSSDVGHSHPLTPEEQETKDSNSCSDHSQVCHPPPSSDVVHGHAVTPEEQVQVSEGSRPTGYLENKVPHDAASHQIPDEQKEKQSDSKTSAGQSSGQNWRCFPINLNSDAPETDSGFSPMTKSESSGQEGDVDLPLCPAPTPKDSNREPEEIQTAEMLQPMSLDVRAQVSDMRDLQSPIPKPASGKQGQPAESETAKVAGHDSVPSWSSASSLVVGGAHLPEAAEEWGRYASIHAKPSAEELSSGLVSLSSMKPPEVVGDHATPTSNIDPFANTSSDPTPNASSWQLILEQIEFSTLAEESVSDLLAEVDAMESQGGLSPTSAMRRGDEMMKGYKNDSFSIEDLSPSPDPGKSDAFSSTGDLHLTCQSTVTNEPVGASRVDAYDPLRRSRGHSSTSSEGETKPADFPANRGGAGGSGLHPRFPHMMSQQITDASMLRSPGVAGMDTIWGRVPGGHVNLNWVPPAQGIIPNIGWVANQGAPWGNLNVPPNIGPYPGGVVWDGQRWHAGPVDWVQGAVDMGHGSRGRPTPFPFWNRPSPKGQRVCKFYESGRCKKGALCDYLHP